MNAAWATFAWIAFNALFVLFLVWRGYCRDRKRCIRRAKRERMYENLRGTAHNTN